MAGFGWSMRHGNNNMHDCARKGPYATTQIACRICDQVFLSTQALINHIETHMVENETAVSRKQHELNLMLSQRDLFASPFQHNFPMGPPIQSSGCVSQVLQEGNPFHGAIPLFLSPLQAPPLQLSSLRREHLVFGPQMPPKSRQQALAQHRSMAAESPRDCTKPFLDQLQQAISADHVVKQVESEDHGNNKYDSEILDLTLRL